MNAQALKHPRTLWSLEAAMWRAIEYSRKANNGFGSAFVKSATGKVLLTACHDRSAVPAFSFYLNNGQDITAQVLAVLRGEK